MHPLDDFVSRRRWIAAPLIALALALGTGATYLFMFASRHDDGRVSYAQWYALALSAVGVAIVSMWLGLAIVWAARGVVPVEVDLSRPPGLGEPSQIAGVARLTGTGLALFGALYVSWGVFVGIGEGFSMPAWTVVGVGALISVAGLALMRSARGGHAVRSAA